MNDIEVKVLYFAALKVSNRAIGGICMKKGRRIKLSTSGGFRWEGIDR